MDEICGTCINYEYDDYEKDWYCGNLNSDNYSTFVDSEDTCMVWEKEREKS